MAIGSQISRVSELQGLENQSRILGLLGPAGSQTSKMLLLGPSNVLDLHEFQTTRVLGQRGH